jgi:hypothetical protein
LALQFTPPQEHAMRAKTAPDPAKLETTDAASREALYRMKWLSAHNHLHALVHNPSSRAAIVWDEYLDELQWVAELLEPSD